MRIMLFLVALFLSSCDREEKTVVTQVVTQKVTTIISLEQVIEGVMGQGQVDSVDGIREMFVWLLKRLESGDSQMVVAESMPSSIMVAADSGNIVFNEKVVMENYHYLPPEVFRDHLLIVICHEVLHLRLTPEKPKSYKEYLAGEELVWRETIEKIVRPMIAGGRHIDQMSLGAAVAFAAPNKKEWRQYLEEYLAVPPR